jgi:hypothetical protein
MSLFHIYYIFLSILYYLLKISILTSTRQHSSTRFYHYYCDTTTPRQQFTRDALIVLAGSKAKGRDFVYFTEVKRIPSTDLATIERLWNKFSGGKFGYTVQKVRVVFLYFAEVT